MGSQHTWSTLRVDNRGPLGGVCVGCGLVPNPNNASGSLNLRTLSAAGCDVYLAARGGANCGTLNLPCDDFSAAECEALQNGTLKQQVEASYESICV